MNAVLLPSGRVNEGLSIPSPKRPLPVKIKFPLGVSALAWSSRTTVLPLMVVAPVLAGLAWNVEAYVFSAVRLTVPPPRNSTSLKLPSVVMIEPLILASIAAAPSPIRKVRRAGVASAAVQIQRVLEINHLIGGGMTESQLAQIESERRIGAGGRSPEHRSSIAVDIDGSIRAKAAQPVPPALTF